MGAIRPLSDPALLRCVQCGSIYMTREPDPPSALQQSLWSCGTCQALEAWRPADSLRLSGVVMTMRLTAGEYLSLRNVAAESNETMSDVIREALYEWYGIGDLCPSSVSAASSLVARHNVA
jgi:hypothetical protein